MKKKRTFTVEQKMQILHEAEENGMLSTCKAHDIAQSLFYRRKDQFNSRRLDGLQPQIRSLMLYPIELLGHVSSEFKVQSLL